MFGTIPFVKAAGKGLGKLFGKDKKELLVHVLSILAMVCQLKIQNLQIDS